VATFPWNGWQLWRGLGGNLRLEYAAWANTLGVVLVFDILNNLYNSYGEDRYRPSALLRRKAITDSKF